MGVLKKPASGVPCLRWSGFAQAGRPFVMLTYSHVRSACQRGCGLPFGGASGQDWTAFLNTPSLAPLIYE